MMAMITALLGNKWLKFAGALIVLASFFACYTLYQKNVKLNDSVAQLEKTLKKANEALVLQKKLTTDALSMKQKELVTTETVTKYAERVEKVLVKENPELAIDANRLWQEALKDE